MRAAVLASVLILAGCGADAASEADAPPVDAALVALLADLHLADARATLAPDSTQPHLRDSLRAVALAAHDTEAEALDDRLDALSRDPALARATYDATEDRLEDEGQGFLIP
ncbi:MAG: hypothetical protein AAF845_08925 [Bacteroidota bacterium]